MPRYPFQNPDGSVNIGAMYTNAILEDSLYHNDQGPANVYSQLTGLPLLDWYNDHSSLQPDHIVFRDATTALVVYGATTNATQWLLHIGGSVIPLLDPVTQDSIMTSVWSGTIQSLPTVGDLLDAVIKNNGVVRITGHSYGAGCAFALGVWLKNLHNANVEVMGFGEPKVFGGLRSFRDVDVHFRITTITDPDPYTGKVNVDPFTQMPPGCMQYVGLGYVVKIAAFLWSLKFQPRGQQIVINTQEYFPANENFLWSIPFVNEALLVDQIGPGTLLHVMDSGYLPRIHQAWVRSGLYPELSVFEPYYTQYTNQPYELPTSYGQPFPYSLVNQSLQIQDTPITPANVGNWTNVASVGEIIPDPGAISGGKTMTLMRGSMLCGIMNQGFSETFHSGNPAETYASMATKMQAVANGRMKLSNGVNDNPPLAPNNNMSITALRISDDLLVRDVYPVPINTPFGWNGSLGNMDGQQAIKIVWRNAAGAQIAATYLHGIPVAACTANPGNESRVSPMNSTYKTFLQQYCNVIAAQGLGFNTINNNPTNAFGPITACTYNAVSGLWTITVTNAVPIGKFRAALRGFKSLNFLNGRQSCQWVTTNQFIVYRKSPGGAWDNSGTAVPLSGYNNNVPFSNYIVQVPATATPELICTKKLGRPFFLQRGRISRRAA